MANTREELEKAIKHYKCERDNAIVVLDSGFGSRPGESDLLYRKRKERAQIAIDAIGKQIPQKIRIDNDDWKCCPTCGETFSLVDMFGKRNKYCGNCGQALDWEE